MTYTKFEKTADKPKVEIVCQGPEEVERTNGDFPYLIAFGVFWVLWISIAIYAFCTGYAAEVHYVTPLHRSEIIEISLFINEYFHSARFIVLGGMLFATVLMGGCVSLFRWYTKIFIFVSLALLSIGIILLYTLIIYYMVHDHARGFLYIPLVIFVCVYGMIMYAFKKTGIKVVCKVVKESCKAMFFFPSTLLFMVLQFSVQLLIVFFADAVHIFLITIRVEDAELIANLTADTTNSSYDNSNETEEWYDEFPIYELAGYVPYYIYFFHIVNIIGFLWAISFVTGVGRMALTSTFATWYSAKDKRTVPYFTVLRSFITVITVQSGTLAYGSSPASLVPMVIIIYKYERERLKEICQQPILILSWLSMISKFSFDALAMAAIQGHTFYKSAKDSYILLMKNPLSFLAINAVTESVIFLGALMIPIISFFATLGYCHLFLQDIREHIKVAALLVILIASLLMSLTFFLVFRTASNTIRYCYLEDCKFKRESEMDLYQIQEDDSDVEANN